VESGMTRAVIFDLDGTLVDSAPDIIFSANSMLSAQGLEPLPDQTIRGFIGNGVPKLVERVMRARDLAFSEPEHDRLVRQFSEIYAVNPATYSKLYANVLSAILQLRAKGYVLGVVTNKSIDLTRKVLDGFDLSQYFGCVLGGDSLAVHKPDPLPLLTCEQQLQATRMLYVGDSEVDAATALAADRPFFLFTEGYRKSEISDLPHTEAFTDYAELDNLVAGYFA
jgi:phosphoglycolate phosphatase